MADIKNVISKIVNIQEKTIQSLKANNNSLILLSSSLNEFYNSHKINSIIQNDIDIESLYSELSSQFVLKEELSALVENNLALIDPLLDEINGEKEDLENINNILDEINGESE